jgi:DMSO/TMAO reductase YedYZ molybdopterin-dependent catalytic subunit
VTGRAAVQRLSPLHSDRVAAILGIALGVTFTTCFVTGLFSHLAQDPPSWFTWPARPAGLYRVTQGVHVATGLASIPLLLAKLWSVYPRLFAWPPFASWAGALERVLLVALVGGALFQLFTGLANINLWYPWPFNFRRAHYWVAWITIGALIVHVGAKWAATLMALSRHTDAPDAPETFDALAASTVDADRLDRRRFLGATFAISGVVTLFTVGQTARPLARLALLAPRRPDTGPQGFPVNRTAAAAGVTKSARSPGYRLVVDGNVRRRLELTLDELAARPLHDATLPIACVEGWSSSQRWRGVPVRELLAEAGAPDSAQVTVHSLQRHRAYRASTLNSAQAADRDTLLALYVNGEPLHVDHGFPLRLIGPNRPGVQQTKWVARLEVR